MNLWGSGFSFRVLPFSFQSEIWTDVLHVEKKNSKDGEISGHSFFEIVNDIGPSSEDFLQKYNINSIMYYFMETYNICNT